MQSRSNKNHAAPAPSRLLKAAQLDGAELTSFLSCRGQGLTQAEAEARLAEHGPNTVAEEEVHGAVRRFLRTLRNPLVILLGVLAIISFATGDTGGGVVMSIMVGLGISLRFVQESRADAAAKKLKAMIAVHVTVVRDGAEREVPLREVVPGDVVCLSAGDMVPADVRLLASKDLFIAQSALTGESLPAEKHAGVEKREDIAPIECANLCFLGTSVESGTGRGIVVETGGKTQFGRMAESLASEPVDSSFDQGVQRFTWLMIRFMIVMVPLVFFINGFTKHRWDEAFFFSVAVAVGLTPEMLPMIVSVCLSKGAIAMSQRKVIVKQLNAIQNFGAMDVLCTDKTGTLTRDQVILEKYCDVLQHDDDTVLLDAFLLSHFQTGLHNVLDRAVLEHRDVHEKLSIAHYSKVDEIPFDFVRRMMSVCVQTPDGDHLLLTKGAPEAVFARCSHFELNGEIFPMEPILTGDLMEQYQELSADGFRVLAVAYKHADNRETFTKEDEHELTLRGYLAFLDPPKDSAVKALARLKEHGVRVKVLTGDNDLVARKVCCEVGIPADRMVLGSAVEKMSDHELSAAVEQADTFARLAPVHKQRIIEALRRNGHVVGFLGDGINDAPALRAADVGLSVDNAVDIAKSSAAMILLEKDLNVLDDGVIEGRKVFVNILKYVRMGASSNFGNMFSVVGASAFLPFLPMAPIQVLANNLLYDFSQVPIPTDSVGADQLTQPRPWHLGEITRFILFIGPISSIFDYFTFFVMLHIFGCWDPARASLFQSGWFVESLITQTLIIHVIRTNKLPFIEGRASWQLTLTTLAVMAIAAWLPFSPIAAYLGFTPLPASYWPFLIAAALGYVLLTQFVKTWLAKRRWL
jgi:Mg2+-importing ATPase